MFFIKNFIKFREKWAIFGLFFVFWLILAIFVFLNPVLAEITTPTAQPPDNNTTGFIQISDINQGKQGPLRLGTSDIASQFNYQLEVLGLGADTSNAIIDNSLQVSNTVADNQKTLIVDSESSKVCIGECMNLSNSKLEVSGTGVIINNITSSDNTLSVYSSGDTAIYGSGPSGGIYSIAAGDNYAIYGLNTSGTSVEGHNILNTYSSVAGFSDNGTAIYGTNSNLLGLWSGYFNGRLQVSADISGSKLLTKNYSSSLASYTSGQLQGSYNFGDSKILYHDGTYYWLAQNDTILKIRASDGFQVFDVTVGDNIISMISDENYFWAVYDSGIAKINPEDGNISCSITLSDPKGIAYTGINYWVTVNSTGQILNIDENCATIGSAIDVVDETQNTLGKIIYNGSFLWALSTHDVTGNGSVINLNPSTGNAVRWDNLVGSFPVDIYFDNYYYWVLSAGQATVNRFYLQDSKVCTQLSANDTPVSCAIDTDCSNQGLGICGFVIPQSYGSYFIYEDPSRVSNSPTNFVFSDSDIWVNNVWNDGSSDYSELVKISQYDPTNIESFSLTGTTNAVAFDQSSLWVSSSDADLLKIYSGTGYGKQDLSETLALQNNSSQIIQAGSFDIDGTAKIDAGLNAEGDLITVNNSWGDREAGDFIYNDSAMIWSSGGILSHSATALLIASDGKLYTGGRIGALDAGVSVSDDYGQTWTDTGHPAETCGVLTMIEASDGRIYAGGGCGGSGWITRLDPVSGIWTTVKNWDLGSEGPPYALLQASNGYLYSVNNGFGPGIVFRSVDNGDNWSSLGSIAGVNIIYDIIESSGGVLYIGTGNNGDVMTSTDQGVTWNNTGDLPGATRIHSLLWTSRNVIFAGGESGTNGDVIWRSTNAGGTWELLTNFASNFVRVSDIVEAPDGSIYASGGASGNPPEEVYRSYDNGDTWIAIPGSASVLSVGAMVLTNDTRFYLYTADSQPSVLEGEFSRLDPGVYNCPAGHFLVNLALNDFDEVVVIECRPL